MSDLRKYIANKKFDKWRTINKRAEEFYKKIEQAIKMDPNKNEYNEEEFKEFKEIRNEYEKIFKYFSV